MKTSARMFLLFALFALIAGGIYAAATHEFAGLVCLFIYGAANVFLAFLCARAGDPEVEKRMAAAGGEQPHHDVHLPPPSIWPFVIALGAAVLAWGTLLKPFIAAIGVVILLIGVSGWAGGFRAVNRDLAAWGEVWRYRQYRNLADIEKELERAGIPAKHV